MNVDKSDMWPLLLNSVRYSMGRSTYVSSSTPETVLRYAEALSVGQIEQIRDEVLREVEDCERAGKFLGMEVDHRNWKRFVEDLNALLAPKEVHEA